MLYFPRPYPDEVIGSLLIRACRHWGMSIKKFNREVFGGNNCYIPMLMSPHLQRIAELSGVNATVLLDLHTVFPYVTAFMPAQKVSQLRQQLLTPCETIDKSLSALVQGASSLGLGNRFCPTCLALNIPRYGESYWHRSHLLPGVLICKTHGQMLMEASSKSPDRLALPHDATNRSLVPLMPYEKLKQVAVASADRLNAKHSGPSTDDYRRLADAAGYRMSERDIAAQQLSRDLSEYFGSPFIDKFGCEFTRTPLNYWPGLMIRTIGPFSPLKHVLLRLYLDQTVKEVKKVVRRKPGRIPRDYSQLDVQVVALLNKGISDLARQGRTLNAKDLLMKIDAWHVYRHNSTALPKSKAVIESFRQSSQCSWPIARKPKPYDASVLPTLTDTPPQPKENIFSHKQKKFR